MGRIKLKINPQTGVIYLPKTLVEDGFRGEVAAFGSGPVVVIVRPDGTGETIKESIKAVIKELEWHQKPTKTAKSFIVDLPDELHRNLKRVAIDERTTLKQLIVKAATEYLGRPLQTPAGAKRSQEAVEGVKTPKEELRPELRRFKGKWIK